MIRIMLAVIRRDLLSSMRLLSELANPLIFFIMVVSLFPLAITPEESVLRGIAPGVVWVAALLATLLSLDMLFEADHQNGTLEQLLLAPQPLYSSVLAKVIAHWMVSGLPLTLLAPLLAAMLYLPLSAMGVLTATLGIGTLLLSFIGAIGAALTVGLRNSGMLLSLLVLPLYIPVLIFAAGAVQSAGLGLPVAGHLALLGAMLAAATVLAPLAISAALKISLSY